MCSFTLCEDASPFRGKDGNTPAKTSSWITEPNVSCFLQWLPSVVPPPHGVYSSLINVVFLPSRGTGPRPDGEDTRTEEGCKKTRPRVSVCPAPSSLTCLVSPGGRRSGTTRQSWSLSTRVESRGTPRYSPICLWVKCRLF